jgi:hypothetical protein
MFLAHCNSEEKKGSSCPLTPIPETNISSLIIYRLLETFKSFRLESIPLAVSFLKQNGPFLDKEILRIPELLTRDVSVYESPRFPMDGLIAAFIAEPGKASIRSSGVPGQLRS